MMYGTAQLTPWVDASRIKQSARAYWRNGYQGVKTIEVQAVQHALAQVPFCSTRYHKCRDASARFSKSAAMQQHVLAQVPQCSSTR